MNHSPEITAIVTRPGLSTSGIVGGTRPEETLLVGVVLDDYRVGWGRCAPRPGKDLPQDDTLYPGPFLTSAAKTTIEEVIAPLLVGKAVAHFRPLAAVLDSLTETTAIYRSPPIETPETTAPKFSRRALFTTMAPTTPESSGSRPVAEPVTRPVHPAIRQGVSQALLAAVAVAKGVSPAYILVEEYGLQPAGAPVPIQVTVHKGQALDLYPQMGALKYVVEGGDVEAELGANGEKLQRFTRLLSDRVADVLVEPPLIVLDVCGGLGRLFGNESASIGKILGALYGLEAAAKPGRVCVQDPVLLDDPAGQRAALQMIRKYIAMRGMSLTLAADAHLHDLETMRSFVQENVVDEVVLDLGRFGSLERGVRAAQLCREARMPFVLAGAPVGIAAQVAIVVGATRVELPAALPARTGVAALYEEMTRLLVEQELRKGITDD